MSTTDIQKLFDFAIQQEIEAYKFYAAAAHKVSNPGVKQIFKELAEEEKGHENLLRHYKIDATLVGKFNALKVDYMIAETQEMPALSLDMKPAEAIAIAMKREQLAAELYKALSASAVMESEKRAFESLMVMELHHKHRLENAFVDIGYPEVF
jgi:rubrerythrin